MLKMCSTRLVSGLRTPTIRNTVISRAVHHIDYTPMMAAHLLNNQKNSNNSKKPDDSEEKLGYFELTATIGCLLGIGVGLYQGLKIASNKESGYGAYPIVCSVYGGSCGFITGPLSPIMLIGYGYGYFKTGKINIAQDINNAFFIFRN